MVNVGKLVPVFYDEGRSDDLGLWIFKNGYSKYIHLEQKYALEVQVDDFLNGFFRKDYCYSKGFKSTIPRGYSDLMVGLTSRGWLVEYIYIHVFDVSDAPFAWSLW